MKRFTALFLALVMILSLCPVTALAEEITGAATDVSVEESVVDSNAENDLGEIDLQDGTPVQSELASYYVSEEDLGYTDDEVFAAYVQREFDEALGIEAPAMWSSSALAEDSLEKEIYDKLKPMLAAVADGDEAYPTAEFSVNLDTPILLTEDELGVEEIFVTIDGDLYVTDEAVAAIRESVLDFELVWQCLLADCPLELYWHDKSETGGLRYGPQGNDLSDATGDKLWLTHAAFSFAVSADYSVSGAAGTCAVDTDKTGATSNAVENAVAIVEEHASKGNYAKLEAYRDEICALVEYNTEAAEDDTTPYGDPWQMIHVFDGDVDTKVVCEGYSKAFQYLCDLSTFSTNEVYATPIECHTVYGEMLNTYDGDGGPHMWNVVTMDDGLNYLVDVTNCDMGSYGDDDLFIVPADGDLTWTIKYDDEGTEYYFPTYTLSIAYGRIYDYIYDLDIETIFGDACYLSQTAYEEPVAPVVEAQWGVAGTNGTKPTQWESGTLFEAVSYANELSSGTAYIQLIADVETDYGYYFWEDTTTILDLNGHTIDRNLTEAADGGSVIDVGGDLTLCDSSTTVVANQGKITGGYSTNAAAGGVDVTGTFIMEGGRIIGNMGQSAGGVAVYSDATFVMNDGIISGNAAITQHYDDDTFTGGCGGGVCVFGTFMMSGGTITDNEADFGAGVDIEGAFIMSGGEISKNIAVYNGGGVYNTGTMSVSGEVQIVNNTADEFVSNTFLGLNIPLMVTGALAGDAAIGVDVEDYPSANTTVPVAVSTDSHTITQADAEKFFHDSDYTLKLDDESNAVVMVSEASGEDAVEAQWGVAKSDGTAPDEWVDSGTMEQARKYANKLESGSTAYIRLLSDIEVAGGLHFASEKETILDLNGKTIDRGLTAALDNGSVIFISGDLTICDTSTNKNGMLTGAYTNGAGAIVLNDGSAFTLTSGNISGNNAPGVTVWGTSEFNMTGGTISGNAAPYSGGGVVVEGTFNMSGGTISGNTANEGGGVYSYGTMNVSGAPKISGNVKNGILNATTGLYEPGRNGSVNNVYLQSGSVIAVTDKLNDGATIGVANKLSSDAVSVTVAIGSNYALNDTDAAKFVSDEGYVAKWDKNANAVVLAEKPPALTGTSALNPGDVMLFNDMDDTKLSFDGSNVFAMYEDVYFVCDEAKSYTLYLAEPSWYTDTFTVTDQSGNLVPMGVVGTMDAADGLRTVYALEVDKPMGGTDQTVSYTMTRSWKYLDDNGDPVETEVEFTLTFDFTPVLTVKSGAGTDKVKIFNALDTRRGVLSNDGSISFHDGFLISAGGKTETTVYLAVAATDALAVSYASSHGDVPMEHVGTYIEGIPHRVYAVTAEPPTNGDGFIVYNATCWYRDDQQMPSTGGNMTGMPAQTIRLICDFYLKPGDTVPMTHNGLRIYGTYEDGKLGYLNLDSFDEMAYNDTVNAVQVPCRPNQDKTIYLVSSKPLSLDSNEENASLTICEDADVTSGYTAYRLTVNGQGSDYRVSVSNGTKTTAFDFWFSSVVLNRTSFYTTTDDYVNFGYENPVTCDGLSVEDFNGDLVLKVPYTIGKAKTLFFVTDDGDITDVTITGGGLKKMCTSFRGYNGDEPLNIYGLTLSEKATTTGNVILTLWKEDDNGDQYKYAFTNILFVPYTVELETSDFNFNVNLFANVEKQTFTLGESLYDITDVAFENEKLNEAFELDLNADSTISIVPRTPGDDGDWAAWGKACAGTHKSAIKLYYGNGDGDYCTTEELTFKLTATLPKVTAKAVKFNSFYENQESVLELIPANGAGISRVEWGDNELDWIEAEIFYPSDVHEDSINNKFFLKLNSDSEELKGGKASGKLNLEVYVKGYRAPVPVTVSVSAASTAPKLKLNVSSVSLVADSRSQSPILMQLLSGDKKVAFSDIGVTSIRVADVTGTNVDNLTEKEAVTYAASEYISLILGNDLEDEGYFLLDASDNSESGKALLLVTIDGANEELRIPLTVKAVTPTLKATPTKVTLNTAMGAGGDAQTVVLSTNVLGFNFYNGNKNDTPLDSNVSWTITDAKTGEDCSDKLDVTNVIGTLTIKTKANAAGNVDDGNYKITVSVDGAAKPVVINVTAKATLPKMKLSKSSIILNTAMGDYADKQTIEVTSSDPNYTFGTVTATPPVGSGLSAEVNNENGKLLVELSASEDTPNGTYKFKIVHTMPGGQPVESPLTVKVESKPPVLKTATKSLTLDREHGIATVTVTGLTGFDGWDLEVKADDGIAFSDVTDQSTFTVCLDKNNDLFKSGKITVKGTNGTDETKPITISVKAAALSASASVKGNMDVTRPVDQYDAKLTANFTFKYTGWYSGSYEGEYAAYAPTLNWEVYATNGKAGAVTTDQGALNNDGLVASSENANGWFLDVDGSDYGVSLAIDKTSDAWEDGQINPKYTYNVYFMLDFGDGEPIEFSKPVKMTVKQGSVKFAAPKTVALGEKFSITCADGNVAKIADVVVSETVAKPSLFVATTIKDEEGKATGECYINLKDAGSTAKSGSIKLNIWLEGNSTANKPNATVSLKVTVQ